MHAMRTASARLGGAFTCARAAQLLGESPLLIYPRGNGLTDRIIQAELDRLKIETLPFPSHPDPALSVVWIAGPEVDRSFTSRLDFWAVRDHAPAIPEAAWVHVPGLRERLGYMDRLRDARSRGAKISVSMSSDPDLWKEDQHEVTLDYILIDSDLLFLNQQEAVTAWGSEARARKDLARLEKDYVLTRGPLGAVGRLRGRDVEVSLDPAKSRKFANTTGAGDVLATAVLHGLLEDQDPQEILKAGCAAALRHLEGTLGL